jgi:hypothetical protein
MELTEIDISPKEPERVAGLAYQGRTIRACLAYDPNFSLTFSSPTSAYDALKISASGYSDYTATLALGSYDDQDGRFEIGETPGANQYILAKFGPFPGGATFNLIYYVIGSHSEIYGRNYLGEQIIPPGSREVPYPFMVSIS